MLPTDYSRHLITPRCVLRPLTGAETQPLHTLWTSPGVRHFLWDDALIPTAQTRAAIEQSEQLFEAQGFGLWGARLATSPDLIGFAGLWPFRDPPEFELLYGIAEPLWGQGFATEIAAAVLTHSVTQLEMTVVRASTDRGNTASDRVLKKLGFRTVDRRADDGAATVFYEYHAANTH